MTREGIILKWLKNPNGGILYLDGFNYGENGVVSLIESLADFRGNVYIPELGETLTRTKEHYIVISYNPTEKTGYSGTFIQNIATMRRFEGLIVDYLSITAETKIVKKYSQNYDFARKFVELASKTRELYKKSKLRTPLTTGNIINYAKLWKEQKLSEEEIIEIAKSLYPEDELSQFAKLYEDANELDLNKLKQEAGET
jgi:midasin (ATPase involved in ribosome maturation)